MDRYATVELPSTIRAIRNAFERKRLLRLCIRLAAIFGQSNVMYLAGRDGANRRGLIVGTAATQAFAASWRTVFSPRHNPCLVLFKVRHFLRVGREGILAFDDCWSGRLTQAGYVNRHPRQVTQPQQFSDRRGKLWHPHLSLCSAAARYQQASYLVCAYHRAVAPLQCKLRHLQSRQARCRSVPSIQPRIRWQTCFSEAVRTKLGVGLRDSAVIYRLRGSLCGPRLIQSALHPAFLGVFRLALLNAHLSGTRCANAFSGANCKIVSVELIGVPVIAAHVREIPASYSNPFFFSRAAHISSPA